MNFIFTLVAFLLVIQAISCSLSIKKHSRRQINSLLFEKLNNKQIVSWWNKRILTWTLIDHPVSLNWNETLDAFERAFAYWSSVSSLRFITNCKSTGCERKGLLPQITIQFINSDEHETFCNHKFSPTTLAHGNVLCILI